MNLIPPKFLLFLLLLTFPISCIANQGSILRELIKSQKSYYNPLETESWEFDENDKQPISPVHIGPQAELAESSRISSLPGQPAAGVDFNQYAGYITVDPNHGRALFYYFVESPQNVSSKPLVLWLNGGPGCSSFGFGAMEELGPFRVNSNGKTLYGNEYAWNNVANVIFLESPAGVGFSYSNTSSDYITGDRKTADDAYTFLVNWLERYPQYKTRDLYLTGESYAGHYVPQLAYTIQLHNKHANKTIVNLKGIAIGNAYIDLITTVKGTYDFYWTHAMNSDETSAAINKYCDFITGNFSSICNQYQNQGEDEVGFLDEYNIYAPVCRPGKSSGPTGSVTEFDPCSNLHVKSYLNLPEVQAALHAKATNWTHCGGKLQQWIDKPATVLPIIKNLMESGIRLWIFSGDIDAVVSVTTSRYAINTFNLPAVEKWRAWNLNGEVGGYVVGYKGLTFLTVRGAGHEVPSYKPEQVGGYVVGYKGLTFVTVRGAGHDVPSYQLERALTMISSFLQETVPPTT